MNKNLLKKLNLNYLKMRFTGQSKENFLIGNLLLKKSEKCLSNEIPEELKSFQLKETYRNYYLIKREIRKRRNYGRFQRSRK